MALFLLRVVSIVVSYMVSSLCYNIHNKKQLIQFDREARR